MIAVLFTAEPELKQRNLWDDFSLKECLRRLTMEVYLIIQAEFF
jgi:hypothetical protein